ncbi:hypothetical protein LTR37_016081 [Vermiconidia calcicola]|uniref:Uncharacterized protein n=1 Tax=Vermiconidia calcicola TaxID=1690605 RepID=A0ACC3MRN4_9PEZI|nr:hypothetical protein LTR37_016081 [Vermiconidia calcicola]
MRSSGVASAVAGLIATTSFFIGSVNAQADPIVIKGSKFFYENNGTQFYIRGIAYQQSFTGATAVEGTGNDADYDDPLADPKACRRDLEYLTQLRTNTLRVYAVNPDEDHDECMNMFANAGIYIIADLSAPSDSIDSNDAHWNDDLYARYVSVVDAMQGYTNTLGFFAGNEVATQPNNSDSAAFVKAAVRDMKSYISFKGYRDIGVGYAANDNQYIRTQLADFFNCGDVADAIDFYGYNVYSWCGDSSFQESGFDVRTEEFEQYSVPAFFAEYGCNDVSPRPFTEVGALYGPQMNDVWSGGIVYMYFQEENDYGLVTLDGDSISTLADFNNLKSQIAKATPTGVQMDAYRPSNSPASCPSVGGQWHAQASPLPPTPNQQLCNCMYESLSCVPAENTPADDYQDMFDYVCENDKNACAGIQADGESGEYGAYSMCDSKEQLGFVLDQYYKNQRRSSDACDFKGQAKLQQARNAGGNCQSLIAEAGKGGTGTVTSAPSGTGASSGNGGGATSSTGAAAAIMIPTAEFGLMPMAFVVTLAALSGMGMLLL